MKFIHTSDWQLGKVFRFVERQTMGVLQQARLDAITRLGKLALQHDAGHVLVAGDVYDMEALSSLSLHQPLERMRSCPQVTWHLLPGNHDPHRPNGLWDQLLRSDLPENVQLYLDPTPRRFDNDGFAVLPAPLHYRRTLQDPTAYMDGVELPSELIRIGLAHGTITGFGSDDKEVSNYIDPQRPGSAGLAYLALGDWHGQRRINERVWYSGTPETDTFAVEGGGQALLVEIDSAAAVPVVTPLATGHYQWLTLHEQVNSRDDIDALVRTLRASADDLAHTLVQLRVEGALSLQDRQYFDAQVSEQVAAAFCHLRIDAQALFATPTAADLDQIEQGGFVRAAADALKEQSQELGNPDRELAALALQRLYVEHMKLQAGSA